MRWDALRVESEAADQPTLPTLPLALPGATVRTFATPGFRDMTFYEVRAKSIVNRVPGSSRVPFSWTVNPYRGCSHACTYCLAGDTPILLADGRTRPLAALRVGDELYGTSQVGGHRFLTDQGWKHVTGTADGPDRRPHLELGDRLVGVGAFARPAADGGDYRRGYLRGLVGGDGPAGSQVTRRFRLALADDEALDRAGRYLAEFGVPTVRGPSLLVTGRRTVTTIQTVEDTGAERAAGLVARPGDPTPEWHAGLLAGAFDAGGGRSGSLRIAPGDKVLGDEIASALDTLDVRYVVDDVRPHNGRRFVRLVGGLPAYLRFLHTVDPAITRKRTVDGLAIEASAQLAVVAVEPLRMELPLFDITTGTGDFIADGVVSHNCFARNTHTYLDMDAGRDFDTRVVVKVNAGELLRRELAAPRWGGGHIAMGTNVDCYQRAEGRYRLMRGILAALRDAANPFSILTKGTLILRDLDLLRAAADVTDVGLSVSVGSVDEQLWRAVEPGTPSPRRRLDVVRALTDANLPCGVLMAPILPGLSDAPEQIEETVAAIAAAGARSVTPLTLHLRPGAREWYREWLVREHPDLVPRYRELYAHGAYPPGAYQRDIAARVRIAARRHGLGEAASGERRRVPPSDGPTTPTAHQLELL